MAGEAIAIDRSVAMTGSRHSHESAEWITAYLQARENGHSRRLLWTMGKCGLDLDRLWSVSRSCQSGGYNPAQHYYGNGSFQRCSFHVIHNRFIKV
jgi:hypothetical protein